MKRFLVRTLCIVVFLSTQLAAQEVIPLQTSSRLVLQRQLSRERILLESLEHRSRQQCDQAEPDSFQAFTGVAKRNRRVICPGGGFMALSINSESIDVAKYIAARGVTAFVLKYRLAHTGEYATQEFVEMFEDKPKFQEMLAKVVPLSIADVLNTVTTFASMRRNVEFPPTASASSASPLV